MYRLHIFSTCYLKSRFIPTMTQKLFLLFAYWILNSMEMFNSYFIQQPISMRLLIEIFFSVDFYHSILLSSQYSFIHIPFLRDPFLSLFTTYMLVPQGSINSNLPIMYSLSSQEATFMDSITIYILKLSKSMRSVQISPLRSQPFCLTTYFKLSTVYKPKAFKTQYVQK